MKSFFPVIFIFIVTFIPNAPNAAPRHLELLATNFYDNFRLGKKNVA